MEIDFVRIDEQLALGKRFKITYRYPRRMRSGERGPAHGTRSDQLLDVSTELRRLYTLFRGETPIWLEEDEILEVVPDDGVYEELSPE